MKKEIKWHQEGLSNSINYYDTQYRMVLDKLRRILLGMAKNEFYKYQIDEAIRQGKDGFDRERFLKSIKSKIMGKVKNRIEEVLRDVGELRQNNIVEKHANA